ncbi:FMR [Mytilus edulis]|uniref:FMR n=1 Tax=Mytilus edulis TaxID=6550 RepID=A0A8S3U0Q6_MYTED|nr:FMR [Mytilus edulis]
MEYNDAEVNWPDEAVYQAVYKETFTVPLDLVGLAIGTEGANINKSRQIKGVVDVQKKKEAGGYSFTVFGQVIGKLGHAIEGVINKSLVNRISVQDENDDVIFNIIGPPEAIENAKILLNNKLEEILNTDEDVILTIIGPSEAIDYAKCLLKYKLEKTEVINFKRKDKYSTKETDIHKTAEMDGYIENDVYRAGEKDEYSTVENKVYSTLENERYNTVEKKGYMTEEIDGYRTAVKDGLRTEEKDEYNAEENAGSRTEKTDKCSTAETGANITVENEIDLKDEISFERRNGNEMNRRDHEPSFESHNIKDSWEMWDSDEEPSFSTELDMLKG